MRTSMRLVLPLAQVAVAIALKTHTYLAPDTWENPAGLGPDNQFCDALNAPATMIRQCLLWIVPRLECLPVGPCPVSFRHHSRNHLLLGVSESPGQPGHGDSSLFWAGLAGVVCRNP